MYENVLTIVMAGGAGERLYPLTKHETKSAVPFAGNHRLIDPTFSNCINSGLYHIFVLTQFKQHSLNKHIDNLWDITHPRLGSFLYKIPAQQREGGDWYKGTADSVRQSIYHIEDLKQKPDYVLILSGDHVYKMDYRIMIKKHLENEADMTISLIRKPKHVAAGDLGVVGVDKKNWVIDFKEKPAEPKTIPGSENDVYASMGLYAFKTKKLLKVLYECDGDDFAKHVIPFMIEKGYKIYGYDFGKENRIRDEIYKMIDGERKWVKVKNIEHSDHWEDVGNIKSYFDANMDLVDITPKFDLYSLKWNMGSQPPAKLVQSRTLVCEGCIINGEVEDSILSPGVTVEKGACVKKSIIFGDTQVEENAYVERAIIDNECVITAGREITPETLLGYNIPDADVKDEIAVIPKGTRI